MRNALILLACALLAQAATAATPTAADGDGAVVVQQQRSTDEQIAELSRIVAEAPAEYQIGSADVLSVVVFREPDLSVERAIVRPDGFISLPLIGDVRADGRTVGALAEDITRMLGRYVLDPKVNVRVDDLKSASYTVYGEVATPGSFQIAARTTISAAIARSGGLKQGNFHASTIEIADLSNSFISRGGRVLPVDFVRLLRDGDLRYDIELRPGDHIHIASGLSKEIYVLGEVRSPMVFAYQDRMSLARTIAMSEGFSKDADKARIHVVRGSLQNPTVLVANYKDVLEGRQRDIALEPGDIVYVPNTRLSSVGRILDYVLPAIQTVQNGIILGKAVGTLK